jgi:hypothetical protein
VETPANRYEHVNEAGCRFLGLQPTGVVSPLNEVHAFLESDPGKWAALQEYVQAYFMGARRIIGEGKGWDDDQYRPRRRGQVGVILPGPGRLPP